MRIVTPTAQRAKNAAEHRHAVDRLVRAYESAAPDVLEDGRAWYPTAQAAAARLARPDAGISTDRAAAIIAALSPQVRWRKNVESAGILIDATAEGTPADSLALDGYPANHAKAFNIAMGRSYGEGEGDAFGGESPKVRAFHRAICGDANSVVLDVWAMRCATGKDGPPPSGARYRRAAEWYRAAAAKVGEHPRDFQAIVWLATRGQAENDRDKEAISK